VTFCDIHDGHTEWSHFQRCFCGHKCLDFFRFAEQNERNMTKQRIGLVLGIFVFLFEIQLEKGIVEAGSICFILFVFYVCIQPT